MTERKDILSLLPVELEKELADMGQPRFRAAQIFQWLGRGVRSFEGMTNLSKELRAELETHFFLYEPKVLSKQISAMDGTIKYLWELSDGNAVETVVMSYKHGNTVCVSSQVGCLMGCTFCASAHAGFGRSLTGGEMLGQVLLSQKHMNERIRSVVVMGIGEPFDNYDNVLNFIKIINNKYGLNIGARHITVSTCGIVPKILEFADFPLQINLAISLHAPNNSLRDKIMPINKAYPLEVLIPAIKEYLSKTNRRVTFEYIMLKDINDSLECAKELSDLVRGINCYINLIPYNETNNLGFLRSNTIQIERFYDILKKNNIGVTIRREFGTKISAACGQLRSKKEEL